MKTLMAVLLILGGEWGRASNAGLELPGDFKFKDEFQCIEGINRLNDQFMKPIPLKSVDCPSCSKAKQTQWLVLMNQQKVSPKLANYNFCLVNADGGQCFTVPVSEEEEGTIRHIRVLPDNLNLSLELMPQFTKHEIQNLKGANSRFQAASARLRLAKGQKGLDSPQSVTATALTSGEMAARINQITRDRLAKLAESKDKTKKDLESAIPASCRALKRVEHQPANGTDTVDSLQ